VALARALVAKPKVLLLDEPLSNLDAKLRDSMRFEIKEIQTQLGFTVVFVTHDQIEAMTMSDRIIVINHGIIQQVGSPTEIYRRPANQFVADFVGKINFMKATSTKGILTITGTGQTVDYAGPLTGNVVLGIRPENVRFVSKPSDLTGRITSTFYLGDVNDCRVDIGGVEMRVIAEPKSFDAIAVGQEIHLRVDEFSVFQDDGSEDHTRIVT
jgi:iron(III) transport system ATP-binding protein